MEVPTVGVYCDDIGRGREARHPGGTIPAACPDPVGNRRGRFAAVVVVAGLQTRAFAVAFVASRPFLDRPRQLVQNQSAG